MASNQQLFEFNWNLLFSLLTFLLLFWILKHFFFEKVHAFMEQRAKEVEDSLNNAAEVNRLAEEKLANYEERIANVETESRAIIKKARDEAKIQADGIISEANDKAREAISQSQDAIERETFNARKQLRDEVGNLAIMAAEKIMEKEIKAGDHQEIIDKIIEEAEENPWN